MRVREVLKNTMQVFLWCLILSGCFMKGLSEPTTDKPPNALTVVDTEDNKDDVQVDVEDSTEEIDYDPMNVFVPTKEWKTVKPGQVVPDGLHVRLNMETGQKEAKLMEGDSQAKYWKLGGKQGMVNSNKKTFTVDELKKALKDFKSESLGNPSENTEKFKSYKELRKDFEAMNMNVETDMEIITGLINKMKREDTDIDETKHILMDLEYYLHQIDNAVHFADSAGFPLLLKCLNSTSEEIRSETAMVLGSALQSNPKVQITAIEHGFLQMLLRMISVESRVFVRKRVLYALSSLVRHFPYAQLKFVEHGGLSVFSKIFEEDGTEVLKVKIITLLNDLLLERKLTEDDQSQDSDIYKEKVKQYKQLDLEKKLVDSGWCRLIPPVLQLTDHDSREKIINAMNTMITPCYNDFSLFRSQILDLQKFYHRLADVEKENDYFKKIHQSLTKITEMLVITEL